jgi:phage repressor protein C with HTH and peptisase S24 domain
MDKLGYSERIKEIRHHFKMNQTEFANHTNILRSSISEFESGNREPSKEFIKTLNELGVSIDWLLSGEGQMLKSTSCLNDAKILHEKGNKLPSILPPGVSENDHSNTLQEIAQKEALVAVDGGVEKGVLIPVIAQGLSAGFGFDYDEGEIIRYVKVPAWITRSGQDLIALPIYGDSMEPTISNGDLALCGSGGFRGDGLYMLRDQDRGLMFCKRVVWMPGGWTIKSDNPSYEPMKVDDKAIEIIARVIAAIKEVK